MSIRTILFIGIVLGLVYLSFTVGAPFLLALIVAIFLEPVVKFTVKQLKMNRMVASSIICSSFVILLLGLLFLIGLKLFNEVRAFVERLPRMFNEVRTIANDWLVHIRRTYENLPPDVVETIEQYLATLLNWLSSQALHLSGQLGSTLTQLPNLFIFFIVFIVAVYMFSFSLPTLRGSFIQFFHEDSQQKVSDVIDSLRKSIFGFLRSQIILSTLTYIISLVGLLIIDVKYPLAIALLIIIVDILPILGTGSVLVPWAIFSIVMGDFVTAIGLVILFLVITVFRRIVEPKILGDSIGISALAVLISLYVGLKLVGVIGVFIGPLVVIIYKSCKNAGVFSKKIKI